MENNVNANNASSYIVTTKNSGNNKICNIKNAKVGAKYYFILHANNGNNRGRENEGVQAKTNCTVSIIDTMQEFHESSSYGFHQLVLGFCTPTDKNCSFSYSFGKYYTGEQITVYVWDKAEV